MANKTMHQRTFTLWDRRADRAPVTNWSFAPLPEAALESLKVGDAVRLLLQSTEHDGCWEKIYFEITRIDYYRKGGSEKPRKFIGRSMDTYRLKAFGEEDRYQMIQPGDEITFQRRNIIEVPSWHLDSFGLAKGAGPDDQSNRTAKLASKTGIQRFERDAEEAAYERVCELRRWEKAAKQKAAKQSSITKK